MSILPHAQPVDMQTWYHEAEEARKAGDIETAHAAVERILEQDPTRPGALYLRGLLALDSNQFEAAQSWVERAIELNPHVDFYTKLCEIQIRQKAYANALQTTRQGLALQPESLRSLTSGQIAPLLALPHIRWVSLQKTDDPAKRASATTQTKLTDWMDEIADFADTAALIENLDLLISADTSVAHLAAAMGKPVWLLNRFAGCWRWLRNRDDSPWYPTVQLFTQRQRGDWDEVLTRVAAALQQRFTP